jgi:uncharacterized protein YybS (DUF2232 family)
LKGSETGTVHRSVIAGVAISSVMFTVAGTPSILGSVASLALPVPQLFYYSKLGRFRGMLVFVVSLGLASLALRFLNYHPMVLHLFLLGSLGFILSEVLRKNYSIEVTILRSAAALIVLGLLVLVYYSAVRWENPLTTIMSYISTTVAENIDAYAQLGGASDQIELLKRHSEQITRVFFGIFPSILTVGTLFLVWFNVMAGRALFVKHGMWYPDFGDLSRWKLRDRYVWLVIISGLLLILPLGEVKIIGLNVLIIMLFLYLFQGLSVIQFYFDVKRVPTVIRLIGYFLIFAQQFVMLLVVGLGLIDVWADFRKLQRAKQ